MTITIYQKPTCTTCRQVYNILKENGIDFESINYYQEPFTKAKLKALLAKMKIKPEDIVRTKENIYKELKLAQKALTEDQWLELFLEYPDLIQRPIVENGGKAVLARPVERVKEILTKVTGTKKEKFG